MLAEEAGGGGVGEAAEKEALTVEGVRREPGMVMVGGPAEGVAAVMAEVETRVETEVSWCSRRRSCGKREV